VFQLLRRSDWRKSKVAGERGWPRCRTSADKPALEVENKAALEVGELASMEPEGITGDGGRLWSQRGMHVDGTMKFHKRFAVEFESMAVDPKN
jgi:hypothetical protein